MPRPSQYAGNWLQRLGRFAVDRVLPGNQLGADGTLANEGRGLLGLGVQVGSAFVPVPGAALIGRQAGVNIGNNGNPLNFAGNDTRIGELVNAFTNSGGPQRESFGFDTSLDVSDIAQRIGYRPELQTGGESTSAADRMAAELQRIQERINAQAVPTTRPVNVRPIGGSLSFGGGRFNNGVGAGTGFGAANFTNDAWGEAARGFGVGGMAGGSRDQAMSSTGPRNFKQRV